MAGCGLQAAPCPTGALGLVECSTLFLQAVSLWFPAPHWCLWHKGLLDCEKRENPGLSLSTTVLCREIRSTNWSPLWHSMRTPEMHGPFDESQWGWYCGSLAFGTNRWGTQNLPHPVGGSCPPGEEFGLPEVPEAAAFPSNIWRLPSLRNPLSRLTLQVPLFLHPPLQNPTTALPAKQKNPGKRLRLT